jgi:hypothetical protein
VATRVSQEEVRNFTGYPSTDDASQAIAIASLIVDENLVSGVTLTDATRKQIELLLSCHFMAVSKEKGPLAAESIGGNSGASERYHNIYAAGLRSTKFGVQAILLDTSGTLALMTDKVENPNRRKALFTVVGDLRKNVDPLTLMDLP